MEKGFKGDWKNQIPDETFINNASNPIYILFWFLMWS